MSNLQTTSHRCILPSFGSFGQAVSEEKIFFKIDQSETRIACVNGSERNEKSQQRTFHRCFLPSFGTFDQTVSEGKNLKNQPVRNKNFLWRPRLLTERDGMNNLHRGPSIDASYQVSDHLTKRFKKIFRNRPIRYKNCLWPPCLFMNRDEISNLYRGPPIDASYQVSVHLAKRFQRRRFFKIGQSETIIACVGHVC